MANQLTFFPSEKANELEVVEMAFVDKRFTCVEELFQGFNHLYAITFSYGLGFIRKIINYFDTAEIILGCEAVVKFDLKTIMAFQTRTLEELNKHKDLIDRVTAGTLSFRVAKEMLSHQKVFILTSDTGKTRVIVGSANFSARPFSGNQRENIGVFENDVAAFDFYMDEFETMKEFSTNEIVKDSLYINSSCSPEDIVEMLPIVKEAKVSTAGIILDNDIESQEAAEFVYDIGSISNKYAAFMPKADKSKGKTLITSIKTKEMLRKHKHELQLRRDAQAQKPQFKINYEDGSVMYNGAPYTLDVDQEAVKQDLIHIEEYFTGFNDFIGDIEQTKKIYYRVLNYMFLSPFIARLRNVAFNTDFATMLFPAYVMLHGPKSSGKTTFLQTVQTMMFGTPYGSVGPEFFTKSRIWEFFHDATGIPVYIDEVNKERFNLHAGEIVKYDIDILKKRLINHPTFVLASNDIETLKPEYAKRVYYASVDATLTNVDAAARNKKVHEQRKKIGTSFYREYMRRMYDKVMVLINTMDTYVLNEANEDWMPDIFKLSSETILEIYEDCGLATPSYITPLSYGDYFGHNVITEKIQENIIFEWAHNRKAFKVLRKQNLVEYTAGDRKYEAQRICDSLPEQLRARTSGPKVIFLLDEAEKFFGIRFSNTLFQLR